MVGLGKEGTEAVVDHCSGIEQALCLAGGAICGQEMESMGMLGCGRLDVKRSVVFSVVVDV